MGSAGRNVTDCMKRSRATDLRYMYIEADDTHNAPAKLAGAVTEMDDGVTATVIATGLPLSDYVVCVLGTVSLE